MPKLDGHAAHDKKLDTAATKRITYIRLHGRLGYQMALDVYAESFGTHIAGDVTAVHKASDRASIPLDHRSTTRSSKAFKSQHPSQLSQHCPHGQFTDSLGRTQCELCPTGRHAPAEGLSECLSCQIGTYVDERACLMWGL
eukprot:4840710-Amphidinium_carterae.1